jgi:hypothetical protein
MLVLSFLAVERQLRLERLETTGATQPVKPKPCQHYQKKRFPRGIKTENDRKDFQNAILKPQFLKMRSNLER